MPQKAGKRDKPAPSSTNDFSGSFVGISLAINLFRKFMGLNFLEYDAPDATTLLHFRHLLEENGLEQAVF